MVDRTGQNAIQAVSVSGVRATALAAASQYYKWHPGIYPLWNSYNPSLSQWNNFLDSITTGLNGLPRTDNVVGALLLSTWAQLESSRNNYAAGFDYVHACKEACKSRGLRFCLYKADTRFGSTSTTGYLPQYLATEPSGAGGWIQVAQTNGLGVIAKRYNTAIMDRMIALSNAYAGEFNDDSHFEGFHFIAETEMAITSADDPAYTETNYLNQLERLFQSIKLAWTRTNVWVGPNSGFTSDLNWARLFAMMLENRIGRCPPDIRPNDFPPSETVVANYGNTADQYYFGVRGHATYGTRDYRDLIPAGSRTEDPDYAKYGKPFANHPTHKGASGFWHTSRTILRDRHWFPSNKDYQYGSNPTTSQVYWSNATAQPDPVYRMRSFLSTGNHPMVKTPPTCYPGVDTG